MTVEERLEAGLGLEGVGLVFDEAERGEEGDERIVPFVVADVVRMEQIGELFGLGVSFGVRKQRVSVENDDLFVVAGDLGYSVVEIGDVFGGPLLGGG